MLALTGANSVRAFIRRRGVRKLQKRCDMVLLRLVLFVYN